MYDGPYCSERLGPNYGAGSTASELEEYYGDDYDPEWVKEVEHSIGEDALLRRNEALRAENDFLREMLEDDNG